MRPYTLVVVLALSATGTVRAAFTLDPACLYAVVQGGVVQRNGLLQTVGSLTLPGITVTEGLAITPQGTMILSGFTGSSHVVYEIGKTGAILHSANTGVGSLDRAAHSAVDHLGRIYVATSSGILEIAPGFASQRFLPASFSRASGIAVAADNKLYVTDQAANKLLIFDGPRNLIKTFSIGDAPTGLDFDPQGLLNICSFRDESVFSMDVNSFTITTRLTGVHDVSDISFYSDGSYYLSINRGNILQRRSANGILIGSVSTGGFSDSIEINNTVTPVPPTIVIATFVSIMIFMRSRGRVKFVYTLEENNPSAIATRLCSLNTT